MLFRDKLRVFNLQADARWAPERLSWLAASGDLELRQGVQGIGSSDSGDADLSRAEGIPGATAACANATVRLSWGGRPSESAPGGPWLQLTAQTQWTNQPLLAYEQ